MTVYPFKNAVTMSHMFLAPYIPAAACIVDMTCGNGHDTAFLASLMARDAILYAFDIQECAIEATKRQLAAASLHRKHVEYRCGSHDVLVSQIDGPLDVVVFNLGYLPSGDHSLYTKSEITIKAIKICLNKIAKNGLIMIAAYPGTEAGAQEDQAIHDFLKGVPQRAFDISTWRPVNQVHCPPLLYIIQKRG
jgi:SAM-dependent methyltransferase